MGDLVNRLGLGFSIKSHATVYAILWSTESTSSSSKRASTAARFSSMVSSSTSAKPDGMRARPVSPFIPASLKAPGSAGG